MGNLDPSPSPGMHSSLDCDCGFGRLMGGNSRESVLRGYFTQGSSPLLLATIYAWQNKTYETSIDNISLRLIKDKYLL